MVVQGTKPYENKDRVRYGREIKSNKQFFGAIGRLAR